MNSWDPFLERYRQGEWRAPIFRDLILADASQRSGPLTFLDIGCGRGFDDDIPLQQSLAAQAQSYIGVEPDEAITLGPFFTAVHRCFFEDSPIPPDSIDIAFAVMVLEHLPRPKLFWDKVFTVLKEGGSFWGFTVDARHWFCRVSRLMERLRLKNWYLNLSFGQPGQDRYTNYPTYYRSNSPAQVQPLVERFHRCDFINFSREGQLGCYFPRLLQPVARFLDRRGLRKGKAGALLAIHVIK